MAFVCVAKATDIAPGQIREIRLEANDNCPGQRRGPISRHQQYLPSPGRAAGPRLAARKRGYLPLARLELRRDFREGDCQPEPPESPVTPLSYAATTYTWTQPFPDSSVSLTKQVP